MRIYVDKTAAQREAVQELLQALNEVLPGQAGTIVDRPGTTFEPRAIGRNLGISIAAELARLQTLVGSHENQIANLLQYADKLAAVQKDSTDAHRNELHTLRQQLEAGRQQLSQAQTKSRELAETVQRQEGFYTRQIATLEREVADLRRLVARQHHELVDLMGEAYAQPQSGEDTK